jgi:hypothetical protein
MAVARWYPVAAEGTIGEPGTDNGVIKDFP